MTFIQLFVAAFIFVIILFNYQDIVNFFHDLNVRMTNYFADKRTFKQNSFRVNSLARLRIFSDSPKEIESFISENAYLLDKKNMGDLTSRYEQLMLDKQIKGHQ